MGMKFDYVAGSAFHFGPVWLSRRSLLGPLGAPKQGQKLAKMVFFPLFSTLQSKVSSAMHKNEVGKCQWLGLSLLTNLDEPGKPYGPLGGS